VTRLLLLMLLSIPALAQLPDAPTPQPAPRPTLLKVRGWNDPPLFTNTQVLRSGWFNATEAAAWATCIWAAPTHVHYRNATTGNGVLDSCSAMILYTPMHFLLHKYFNPLTALACPGSVIAVRGKGLITKRYR
jgi:hypothetical protein